MSRGIKLISEDHTPYFKTTFIVRIIVVDMEFENIKQILPGVVVNVATAEKNLGG